MTASSDWGVQAPVGGRPAVVPAELAECAGRLCFARWLVDCGRLSDWQEAQPKVWLVNVVAVRNGLRKRWEVTR